MKSILFFLIFLWSISVTCFSPMYSQYSNVVNEELVEKLHTLSQQQPLDLVYIQTSKGIYETQEDVWFKCYVLNAQSFIPSIETKTMYIQLINDKTQQAVFEEKYEIENGFVDGHFYLKNSLEEGIYTLAAYSSSSFRTNTKVLYAVKKLEILKTINSKTLANPVQKGGTVQFTTFPEGGNLVSRIPSTLGFKAVNSKGMPVNVSGTLYENNKPLLNFKSSHAGMGSLVFVPDANKDYHIQLTEPPSKEKFPVAHIYQNGKVLQLVSNTKETMTFKVSQSTALNPETIYLQLQVRGVVYSIASGLLKKESLVKIPLKDIPQGIAEVTLFGANLEPLAERLVYVNQDQKLNIKAELSKSDFATREKVNLKIKVTDQNGQPIVTHLGLSVYDKLYQNKQDSKNIFTHYFLSTQLKGTVYDPAYYFNEKNKDRREALNLLLLTQGWRSYVWNENVLRENMSLNKPILFDGIQGVVAIKNKKNDKTLVGQHMLVAYRPEKEEIKDFILSDSLGVFTVGPQHLKMGEKGDVYLKLLANQDNQFTFNIKDRAFTSINALRKEKPISYPVSYLEEERTNDSTSFIPNSKIEALQAVEIKAKKKRRVVRDKYLGKLDSIAKQEMTTDYVCKHNYLNCPMCIGSKDNKKPEEGKIYQVLKVWNGVQFVEGVIPQAGGPGFINPSLPPYHYQDLTDEYLMERFSLIKIKGYYGHREFYQPIYDKVIGDESVPDYLNTLFWKPDIITNELGEATVDFFCSDIDTVFLGNIEGVSGDGLLGAGNFEFTVRKKGN